MQFFTKLPQSLVCLRAESDKSRINFMNFMVMIGRCFFSVMKLRIPTAGFSLDYVVKRLAIRCRE